jgi:hypothetical protein
LAALSQRGFQGVGTEQFGHGDFGVLGLAPARQDTRPVLSTKNAKITKIFRVAVEGGYRFISGRLFHCPWLGRVGAGHARDLSATCNGYCSRAWPAPTSINRGQ